jgi:hypothetical protein
MVGHWVRRERPLLSVRTSWAGSEAEVTLVRGGSYQLRGNAWRRDFAVTRSDGAIFVSGAPRTSALSFHPHDYVVRQAEGVFDLAELVAVVQIWRMVKKNEAAALSTAGAGAAGA